MNNHARLATYVALALLLSMSVASAATIGMAGGTNVIQTLISWAMVNIFQFALDVGIIIIGVSLLFLHFHIRTVGLIMAGALVLSNYQQIVAMFPTLN